LSPNTAKTLQKGTIMKDLSMEALKKAAAAQKKEANGVTDDPEPAKRKDPGVPLSFDLPPGSSAMLTDLKAARQRSSEDPDDADMERYATAEGLISDLRAHGIEFWTPGASLGEVHYRPASILSDYAKSELERVKSEVYEILREEEEIEAQWEARLASVSEFDPLADRDDAYDEWIEQAEFGELSFTQSVALVGWIEENLEPAQERNERYRHDSYELKHIFERAPEGFYVSDEQFRNAMWLSGYPGRRYPGRQRSYEDCESRYYYVRPNRVGLVEKLIKVGVPSDWAWAEVMGNDEIKGKEL
jgi:hypothetical protein